MGGWGGKGCRSQVIQMNVVTVAGPIGPQVVANISALDQVSTPQLFYTRFYNHAHRLRLDKLLYLGLSRSSNGF